MTTTLIFWLLAGPFCALWLALLVRYTIANKRWFNRVLERGARLGEREETRIDRLLHRLARSQTLYFLAYGTAEIARGPLAMYRPDPDPEIERIRQEAVARYKPMLYIFGAGVALWFVAAVVALIVIAVTGSW